MADGRRTRASIGYPGGPGTTPGMGIIPTPDPTVGSCMSEEDKDVAMQLIRLGEASNISHGRTSASTQDDTFSGRADAASSTVATSDEESESDEEDDDIPPARKQRLDANGNARLVYPSTEAQFIPPREGTEVSADDADFEDGEDGSMRAPNFKNLKNPGHIGIKARTLHPGPKKAPKPKSKTGVNGAKHQKAGSMSGVPMSPSSLPAASRKPSIVSNPAFPTSTVDEDAPDLSSKPRCQRCRKSKKGCDRQRPCGRCKDAGIPADQCISEDEGNGRKGRYGRYMGVKIEKSDIPVPLQPPSLLPAAPIAAAPAGMMGKDKKRKR
jgi:hypothetical protein